VKHLSIIAVVFLFWQASLQAQQNHNLCIQMLSEMTDTVRLDSMVVLASSLSVQSKSGILLDTNYYSVNIKGSHLVFKKKIDSSYFPLQIQYKIIPINLKEEWSHKKLGSTKWQMNAEKEQRSEYRYELGKTQNDIGSMSDFQKSGSISRAISAGNNQNLSVLSHLNLQLSGYLSPELEIVASVSDDNIPIQPDGNTQQLQDFDQVFIQIKHQNGQLTAGDFVMLKPVSNFLNYHKKAQGISSDIRFMNPNNQKIRVYGGLALSKGMYAKNTFQGIEGNQGPYKLTGANFERTIIILSATEQVYVDGKLLTRGQNYDYVIDYNTAEITFMPNFTMTKDKRISVEFQYSDRNYARYLTNAGFEYQHNRWKWSTHYFLESDLKNQPLDQDLSENQKNLLHDIGDSLLLAISPSIDSIGFNGNEVLYKKVDSLGYSPVFIYSTSSDSAVYRLAFTMVGAGNGNYVQQKTNANGRVFKWVAPYLGIKQGDYEPVVLLVTPKRKQMVTSIASVELFKNTNLEAEYALSEEDLNTFSSYNQQDNTASAVHIKLKNLTAFTEKENPWKLLSTAQYEWVDRNFSPIERFRSVEFSRDWNAENIIRKNQQLMSLDFIMSQKKHGSIKYSFSNFKAENDFSANRNLLSMALTDNQWLLNGNASLTQTQELSRRSQFLRHQLNIQRKVNKMLIGVKENAEQNRFKAKDQDSLYLNSFQFQEVEFYIQNQDSASQIRAHYKWREDYLPLANTFIKAMNVNEFGLQIALLKSNNSRLNLFTNYRKLQIVDTNLSVQKPEETAMGRIEYVFNRREWGIRSQTFYQLSSGMETSREYSYIEVAAGQGVYTWIDYNNNTVKEIDEFEVSVFQDQANYIRIYIPGTDFIKTYENQFSSTLEFNPQRIWKNATSKLLKGLSHFSNQLVYSSSLKTFSADIEDFIQPFAQELSDPNLTSLNSMLRNTFFFNRGHAKIGADYSYSTNSNKLLMMNGYEIKSRHEHQLKWRWNINQYILMQWNANFGEKQALSEYFKNREYLINYYESELKISIQPNRLFRLSVPIGIGAKQNGFEYGGQESKSINLGINAKYSQLEKGSWTASLTQIRLIYTEEVNGSIAFEMLGGLLPGVNYTWNLSYQRNIQQNLQLSIMYNGRKSETSEVVHVGSVQLRAYF